MSINIGVDESEKGGLAVIRWESTLGFDIKTQEAADVTVPGQVEFTVES